MSNRGWQSSLQSILSLVVVSLAAQSAKADEPLKPLATFFARYCNECHADGAEEGGLNLDDLSHDLADEAAFARWERIFDRVHEGEMPPADADQPTADHQALFNKLLGQSLTTAHNASKGTVLRRLNRQEYQNTMNDLFGLDLDLISELPEDGRTQEFNNVGESLNVSMVHLRQYLSAADRVIDHAIAKTTKPPAPETIRANYAETREGESHIGKSWKQAEDGAVVFFRELGYPTGMLRTAVARRAGRYKVRVTGYAYQSDQPITFAIGGTTFQRGAAKPTFGYFAFPPGKPTTIEFEAKFPHRYMVEITPWGINDGDNLIRKNGIENYAGPGLAINRVEMEGPLVDEFPSRGHKLIFDGINRREIEPRNPNDKKKSWYQAKFELISDDLTSDVRRSLHRVAEAAFRRPVAEAEMQRYVDLFEQQQAAGAEPEAALRTAVAAIFCSPDFLFLREPAGWLDDHAIAARLSYFLTRTTPDAELMQLAEQKRLASDPAMLTAQVQRLLNGDRRDRFLTDFTDNWLNLREIEFTSPDRDLFPEFDRFLQYSMLKETRHFLAELIDKNESVRNVARSDFAMLNNRLAQHYEIDGVAGPEIRRVQLPADSVRGGFLSQASVLKVSANGTNTSPVVRGVWVLERILGVEPSPPPPGIAGVEPDVRGATTLRELLARHRDVDSCRGCHAMIDPPGFALECFNPIGGFRDRFRSLGGGEKINDKVNGRNVRYRIGPPVDATGQLASGEKFDDFLGFRDLLADDEDRLTHALATKLLTFATGRKMGFSDRAAIDEIVAKSKQRGHGVRDLIELVVLSPLFRRK